LDFPAQPNLEWSSHNPDPGSSNAPWRIYNIGNNSPINLLEYIDALEMAFGKVVKKDFLPIQPGDVSDTWANVDDLVEQFNYKPNTSVEKGMENFVKWFRSYYGN
jgi:UDP-glucuronate 4-epimerase